MLILIHGGIFLGWGKGVGSDLKNVSRRQNMNTIYFTKTPNVILSVGCCVSLMVNDNLP